MCGLVGVIINAQNGFVTADKNIFLQLLYVDALRGEDSTGIAAFHNDGEMEVLKEATAAASFLEEKPVEMLANRLIARGKVALGHNRKKTTGKIEDATAHPFIIDGEDQKPRYAFMHNGTLSNHYALENKLGEIMGTQSYTVPSSGIDSEILGTLLCLANGDVSVIEERLSHVYGAYACMWIDQEKEVMYMLRNKERPLTIAKGSFGKIIGSEWGMITAIADRNNTKIESWEPLDEHVLYSFDLKEAGSEFTKQVLTVKKAKPIMVMQHGGQVTKHTKGNSTNIADFKGGASKNSCKRFRGQHLGKTISFYLDDYIPASFPVSDRWVVMGECWALEETKHIIRGLVVEKSKQQMYNLSGTLLFGVISAVDFDKDEQKLIITVMNITESFYGKETKTYLPQIVLQ